MNEQVVNALQEITENVNRVEVIDNTGRAYVKYLDDKENARISIQDNGRTIKLFIDSFDWSTMV